MPIEKERLRGGLRSLSAALTAITSVSSDPDRLAETIAVKAAQVFRCGCALLIPHGNAVISKAMHADDPDLLDHMRRSLSATITTVESGAVRRVMETGAPLLTPVVDLDGLGWKVSDRMRELALAIKLHSSLIIGMRASGTLVGVIALLRPRPMPSFDEIDLDFAQVFADQAGLTIVNQLPLAELRDSAPLRRAIEEASRANRFLDAIVENIPDMLFVKDADRLAFTRFNRAGEQLLGLSRAELLGKNDFDFFPPEEARFFQHKDRETLSGGVLVEISEEPIQTKNGKRWLHTKKVPIPDIDGVPRYLLGISRDITERKRITAELVDAKNQAEAASRELEAFSYSVAHDLRAPLRGVDGFCQALLEDHSHLLDAEGQRLLGLVRDAASRMSALIDDLLKLSRVTRTDLRVDRVDLSALAASAITRLRELDPRPEVEVVIEPALSVHADARLLSIALDNLLGNAWKFTSKAASPRIELCAVHTGAERAFVVRDNGAGFDMAYANKLFGVFERLHSQDEFPGTGIGLATVARIVHRHRGRVWAEGKLGSGAAFYFSLGSHD